MPQICAVRDTRVNAYVSFIVDDSIGVSLRFFERVVIDRPDHDWSRFAEDFELFHLGSIDEFTGAVEPNINPVAVQKAATIKAQHEQPNDAPAGTLQPDPQRQP